MSGQKSPPVTVLMAVFNGGRWLAESISSVLKQTFSEYEFIIVDDGSTDNSPEIIRRFQQRDPRIIVIQKPNTGLADSLNCGIQKARGAWIARLDADDICDPRRLERQYRYAKSNPNLVFVGAGLRIIDESGNPIKVFSYPLKHDALKNNLLLSRKFPPHSSAFYRTATVRSLGGYRTRLKRAQDWDLWLRLSEAGRLGAIAEPLVKVRKHPNQISHDEAGRRQKIDSRLAITSYWLRRFGCIDPVSIDEDAIHFERFRNWVGNKLIEEGLFEYYEFVDRVQLHLTNPEFTVSWLRDGVTLLRQKPCFIGRYIRNKISGETVARQLACEWSKNKKLCVG